MGNRAFTKIQFTASGHVEYQFTQWAADFWFYALELIKDVQTIFGGFNRLAHFPIGIATFDVQLGQEADCFHRASFI
ncbi:Uncharacterised protein [Vibrio cholerae]|uniref:Uncharacterized protein n=1 Tax=Vibrio cholerae TaxID=666 RepID=A0A655RLQ2_VIBCL|nr:Uncharacterised protein [Vibrio cholerae]CSB05534.1 Uncharacterised protein [Vibrio cholerae]CSB12495.1 Uncharacterised protein [Vibrio cholerae]CSC36428.1 Uncharacterised protein [Vibrio cholerae]CSC64885.1 Uncharacterised protein [Vibrio cholerae]